MYQVFFLAFLALSAGAPLGDNWQPPSSGWQDNSFPQKTLAPTRQLDDDSQLVDSLGGGYSFFKKQPIVARPVIQQKLASYDQQTPISTFADTSNQWSDYTKASVFKHQPKTIDIVIDKHLTRDQGGYTQQDLPQSWTVKANGGYGQDVIRTTVPQPTIVRDFAPSYGQQDLTKTVIIKSNDGYGQQDLPTWTPKSAGGYGQDVVRTLVPQPTLVRDAAPSYGQQDLTKTITIKSTGGYGQQDLPTWTPKSAGGYGQDVVRTLVPQPTLVRDAAPSYGQQDLTKTFIIKSNDGYGQQDLPTWTPKSAGGYGQDVVRTFAPQPTIVRDFAPSYGQQDLTKTVIIKSNDGYGQQDLPTWTPKSAGGYGQDVVRTLVPQPTIVRDVAPTYGQQDLTKTITIKSTGGYGQQDLPTWTPKSAGGYGQDVRTFAPQPTLVRDAGPSFVQRDVQQPWSTRSNGGSSGGW